VIAGNTMNLSRLIFAVVLSSAVALSRCALGAGAEIPKDAPPKAHAEAAAGEEHEPDRNPMAFDPDLAIFTAIVFLILLAVLGKFAWPTIVSALDERERKIADNIAAAEARHEEAKRLLAAHEAKLAAAAGEVRELLEEARRDADHTRRTIEAEGHKAAQDELERALREIKRARDAAVQDLAVSSANVAIDLAGKVIREKLTPDQNNQIIRDAIAKLAANPSQN
jgi:F-type H+-transporting ATPase subunit b